MTFLNNVNISKKLAIGFAIVVTVVAVMCAAVFVSLTNIKSAITTNDESVAQLKLADEALAGLVERQNAVRGFIASGDPSFIKKIEKAHDEYAGAVEKWTKAAPEDAALINAVKVAAAEV